MTTDTRLPDPTSPGDSESSRSVLPPALRGQFQQLLAFGSLILIVAFFSVASEHFLSYANLSGILLSAAVTGILALGTTFVIVTGGIDLSIGTGMTLCAVMSGVFLVNIGLPLAVGVPAAILFGGVIGLVNGFAIAVLKIPPFIATLAMMMIAQGLALIISQAQPIYFNDVPGYVDIALGSVIPGTDLPNAILVFALMAIIAAVVLAKTLLGRFAFAIGSNEEATKLSGVRTGTWKLLVYVFAGLFTGVAGVVMSARLSSAQPSLGLGYELEAIAAVVIGGTSLRGGRGTIVGTIIGALIMAVLTNGLRIMSIPQEWQNVAVGIVILLAVYLDMLRRKEA